MSYQQLMIPQVEGNKTKAGVVSVGAVKNSEEVHVKMSLLFVTS